MSLLLSELRKKFGTTKTFSRPAGKPAPDCRRKNRPRVEQLETRVVPSVLDLRTAGSFGSVDNAFETGGVAIYSTAAMDPTGTGVFDTFLQVDRHPPNTVEQGYNTDATPKPYDDGSSAMHNHSLLLKNVPVAILTDSNNVKHAYLKFILDINEPNTTTAEISLDQLMIWQGSTGNHGGNNLTGIGRLIYDMNDSSHDGARSPGTNSSVANWILLRDNNSGSGQGDLIVYIPIKDFNFRMNSSGHFVGGDYVTLFSRFGDHKPADGGFEEWGVGPSTAHHSLTFTTSIHNAADGSNITNGTVTSGTQIYDVAENFNPNNPAPGGQIDFLFFNTNSGDPFLIDTENTNVNGTQSITTDPLATGTYYVVAFFTGDGYYGPTYGSNAENLTVIPANISISGTKYQDHTGEGFNGNGNLTTLSGFTIRLYIDSNHNGVFDSMDTLVATQTTGSNGGYSFTNLGAGTYFVVEDASTQPDPNAWIQTGGGNNGHNYYTDVNNGQNYTGQDFANAHLGGNANVFTKGFWANSPGRTINSHNDNPNTSLDAQHYYWRALVNSLYLRNQDGTQFTVSLSDTFTNAYNALRSFLLGANAQNMANQLSAQLVAMEFNVAVSVGNGGSLSANTVIYIGPGSPVNSWFNNGQGSTLMTKFNSGATTFGLPGTYGLGFITIGTVESDAIYMLQNYPIATAAGPARTFEESLKIVLDAGNNNVPFFVL